MTVRVHASVTGVDAVMRSFGRKKAKAKVTIEEAMARQAQVVLDRSLGYVPVQTGTLRRSGRIEKSGRGTYFVIQVKYGGRGIPYAVYVHENPFSRHASPTCYKFLERAIRETAGTRAAMVKRLIGTEIRGA